MKPAWDALAASYASSSKVIVADVDCTAEGKPLCERFNVEGFPTIKYFNPPDDEGEVYEGGRDEAALKAHAATLGPGCSPSTVEHCSPEQKAQLDEVLAMGEEARATELTALKAEVKAKSDAHDKLLESLQAQYEASQKELEEYKKAQAPRIKMLKMGAPAIEITKDKDEM
jgi:hypothetical protein